MVPLGRENVYLQGKALKLSEFPNNIVMHTHTEKKYFPNKNLWYSVRKKDKHPFLKAPAEMYV